MDPSGLRGLATHRFDARAWSGTDAFLHVRIAASGLRPGEVLEAISSDPATKLDVQLWAGHCCQEFLGVMPGPGFERIFVRRAGRLARGIDTRSPNAATLPPPAMVPARNEPRPVFVRPVAQRRVPAAAS